MPKAKKQEARTLHTYKATEADYQRAKRRAKKDKSTLVQEIEAFVINYGKGNISKAFNYNLK